MNMTRVFYGSLVGCVHDLFLEVDYLTWLYDNLTGDEVGRSDTLQCDYTLHGIYVWISSYTKCIYYVRTSTLC